MKIEPKYHLTKPPRTEIYVGDNRLILPELKEKVDLIFADPPFNWEVPYDEWKDNMPRDEYLKFTYSWLDQCIRVLAPHGSLWVNIPDDTAAEIVIHLKKRGLSMINWCIWHFRFGQCRNTNFIVSKVHVLYFAKNPNNRIWNSTEILEPSDRATKYADHRTRKTETPGMRVPLDVWHGKYWGRIQGNSKERRNHHQNQIPEIYLERVIKACSNIGDLILDPFLGSGTTCTVARALNRNSIGIEYSEANAESAYQRIKDGAVRIETNFDRTIKKAFYASHQGLSSDEVLIDDKLRNIFLESCKKEFDKIKIAFPGEFNCNWHLQYLRKTGKLGPITGKKRSVNKNDYERGKIVAKKVLTKFKKSQNRDRIMCDPELREKFNNYALDNDSNIDLYLVRRAALGIAKKGMKDL